MVQLAGTGTVYRHRSAEATASSACEIGLKHDALYGRGMFGVAILRTLLPFSEASRDMPSRRHLSTRFGGRSDDRILEELPQACGYRHACGSAQHSKPHAKLIVTSWNISAMTVNQYTVQRSL
jgi:hypothetical protein